MSESFLKALSTPQPIPGGGAAAAYGASVGLALLEKIVRLEIRRGRSPSEQESFRSDRLEQVERLTEAFSRLRDEDGRAYMSWVEARSSSRESVTEALRKAIECPMNIMKAAHEALECVSGVSEYCRKHLLPDLMVVCELLEASAEGAYHIALSNLRLTNSDSFQLHLRKELSGLRDRCRTSFITAEEAISARAGMKQEF